VPSRRQWPQHRVGGIGIHPEALGQRPASRLVAKDIRGETPHPLGQEAGAVRPARRGVRHRPGERLGAQLHAAEEALHATGCALDRLGRVHEQVGGGLDRPVHGLGRGLEKLLALAHAFDLREGMELADANPQQLTPMGLERADIGADGELLFSSDSGERQSWTAHAAAHSGAASAPTNHTHL